MKLNLSKTFLLPLLGEYIEFDPKYITKLRNTFIVNDEFDFPTISILHRFDYKDPDFPTYEEKLLTSELFLKSIDKGEYVIYVFKFPGVYLEEFELFKQSIYSGFSAGAKNKILDFWSRMYKSNSGIVKFLVKTRQILYKDDKLRQQLQTDLKVQIDFNQELGEYVDLNREVLIV